MATTVFAPGDVVQLKSGGAPMTVESFHAAAPIPGGSGFSAERMIRCIWHSAHGHLVEHVFWPHVLEARADEREHPRDAAPAAATTTAPY